MDFSGIIEEKMNEEFFAEFQKINPWFNAQFIINNIEPLKYKNIKDIHSLEDAISKEITLLDVKRIIFAKIFGSFGLKVNLDEAEKMTKEVLTYLDNMHKYLDIDINNINRENEFDVGALYEYATTQVILGTVYAYKKEYVKASYHFLLGLRADIIDFNILYSQFINYVFLKLKDLPKKKANYKGVGFSKEEYMGYKVIKGENKIFIPFSAEKYIPRLKSKKGELVVAKQTTKRVLGFLNRLGSTRNEKDDCYIDIYETLLIDKDYNLKEIQFYFNNYRPQFTNENSSFIIPDNFEIDM